MKKNVSDTFLEDEPTIREVLTEYMRISGYEVVEADCGEQAIELLKQSMFDMAVLDIMVPGIDGYGVLSFIKEQYPDMAVIMLTALEDEKSQVKAFNLYADDYVIKPVSPIILLKRMETILRRVSIQKDRTAAKVPVQDTTHKNGLWVNEEEYSVYYQNRKLPLTLSEYLLFVTLFDSPGRVFTREQLILKQDRGLWISWFPGIRTGKALCSWYPIIMRNCSSLQTNCSFWMRDMYWTLAIKKTFLTNIVEMPFL